MSLGCTTSYNAYITSRGGYGSVLSLPHTSIEWTRALSSVSTATVEIGGAAGQAGSDCCAGLAGVNPWSHELVIERNGERAWAGPIVSINYTDESATIAARDLATWLDRRRIHHRHPDDPTHDKLYREVSGLARDYIADALDVPEFANGNDMGMVLVNVLSRHRVSRVVKHREYKMCLTEVNELSQHMMDWTCIDRTFWILGAEPNLGTINLSDGHFRSISDVTVDGERVVSDQIVTGSGTGVEGPRVYGRAFLQNTSLYGIHESVFSERNFQDSEKALEVADHLVVVYQEPKTSFSGGEADDSFPASLSDLVPGRHFFVNLSAYCRQVSGLYRLVSVDGKADSDGDSLSVGLEPAWWLS